jgi:hypothetical protein
MGGMVPTADSGLQSMRKALDKADARVRVLEKALDELFDAARPYLDRAAPHEELFNGDDLRNFEALSAAIVKADVALASESTPEEPPS